MKRKIEQKRTASSMMQSNEERPRSGQKSRSIKDDPLRPLMTQAVSLHDDSPYSEWKIMLLSYREVLSKCYDVLTT